MATFLDIGLLQKFDMIFPFLLVLVIVWAALSYSKFLGDNKFAHSFIALVLAAMVLLSNTATAVINAMAPWFIVLTMLIFFMLLLSKINHIEGVEPGHYGWLVKVFLFIAIIIFVYSLIDVTMWQEDTAELGEEVEGAKVSDSGKAGFWATLQHPSILGLLLIFLIGAFTIHQLAYKM